jgi:serine/threonine-protein kinase
VVKTAVPMTDATRLRVSGFDRDVVISPDGSRVVYRGTNQLIVRALDTLDPRVIDGLGDARGLFVSPDGQWVGFSTVDPNELKKVAVGGGSPATVTAIEGGPRGATWGTDGTIIYATSAATGLLRVPETGGESTVLTTPDAGRGERDHLWPELLPGGHAVLFTVTGDARDESQIAVLDLRTNTQTVLVKGGSDARYVPTGHLVYAARGTLWAVAFDAVRLVAVGTPAPVLEGITTTELGAVDMTLAANGTLVYLTGSVAAANQRSLVWVDRMGHEEPLPAPSRTYQFPRVSPDGTRIAVNVIGSDASDIWVWGLSEETFTRLTIDPTPDSYPVWTADSQRLVFRSDRAGTGNLFWQAADGTGEPERLTEGPNLQAASGILADGTQILMTERSQHTGDDVMQLTLPLGSRVSSGIAEPPTPLLRTTFQERNAMVSPDGQWVAYESDESGQSEVYVRPFPMVDSGRWLVSRGGGTRPLWSRSGLELFYMTPLGSLMGVRVEAGASWRSSTPARILEGPYFNGVFGRTYDISTDDRRFLVIKEGDRTEQAGGSSQLVVVQNWFEELKRLVPVD